MKPLLTGLGLTDNTSIPAGLLEDEMKEQKMAKKKVGALGKGLMAAKKAAPKDIFCLTWIGSTSVSEVSAKLEEQGFSGSALSVKARAARIRKAKRHALDLPVLPGESSTLQNWDRVKAALAARNLDGGTLAQLELADILKNS